MKIKIIAICLLALCCSAVLITDAPQSTISNGLISASLYLPDASNGYYQATRFDWSGVVASLDYSGHSFYGQWFPRYSPKIDDAITGPVESFTPIGYNDAAAGGTFLTIGVGVLRKPSAMPYSAFKTYDIVNGGKWTVKSKKDQVIFTQEVHDSTGYAYLYTKTVRLIKGKPQMVLAHSLKNIGSKPLETDVFDHNFPLIDKEPTGPNIKVIFPVNVTAQGKGWGTLASINGNELSFLRGLDRREQVYCDSLQGFGATAKDYQFKVQNQKTGAGIKITGDQPLEKVVFWSNSTTYCPEPYIKIKVLPGKEMKWNINYEYYTFTPDTTKMK